MSPRAYDSKNQLDYDNNTKKLNDALDQISKDTKLAATINEVARLSGISRNTVASRVFPKKRLDEIKVNRRNKDLQEKKEERSQLEIISEERDKLTKEVVFWFSEYTSLRLSSESYQLQLKRALDSGEFYKQEFIKKRELVKTLEARIETLNELIRDMNK